MNLLTLQPFQHFNEDIRPPTYIYEIGKGYIEPQNNQIIAYNGVFEQCFQKYLNTFDKNIF